MHNGKKQKKETYSKIKGQDLYAKNFISSRKSQRKEEIPNLSKIIVKLFI